MVLAGGAVLNERGTPVLDKDLSEDAEDASACLSLSPSLSLSHTISLSLSPPISLSLTHTHTHTHTKAEESESGMNQVRPHWPCAVQGYLAHKKHPPRRTLQ